MSILSINNLEKWFGIRNIFSDVSFQINEVDRIALIGNNGEGKTTLLNIVMGQDDYDSGKIIFAKNITIGVLNQTTGLNEYNTLYQEMLTSFKNLFNLKRKILDYEMMLASKEVYSNKEKLDEVTKKYGKLIDQYEMSDGYNIDTRINQVLYGLSFNDTQFNQRIESFSGGEKTKIKLAKLLVYNPDLLLLDEPTNHLDITSIEWLEKYIKYYKGAVLLVSHDRYFMDRTVNKVLELKYKTLKEYKGNYTRYIELKNIELQQQRRDYISIDKERKKLEEQIITFRKQKKFSQIRNREIMLEKLPKINKPAPDKTMNLSFKTNHNKSGVALKVEELSKQFKNKILFENISFEVKWGEKLAILGENGIGKSTLLKILNGLIEASSGIINFDNGVEIGYFDQDYKQLSDTNTLLDEIRLFLGYNNFQARSLLAQFMFYQDDVNKKISCLSGGERNRVIFAKLLSSKSNLLIMDEPTNHLDISSKEVLEKALLDYDGTLIFVSHDRYFINKVADSYIKLEDGSIKRGKTDKEDRVITK